MHIPTCDFCNEFYLRGEDLFTRRVQGRLRSRVVFSNRELRVVPSLGEIVPGHLLVVPSYHVTAGVHFHEEDGAALGGISSRISAVYRGKFGVAPIFFEHGDPTGRELAHGQCVDHAHIHAVPGGVEMLDVVRRDLRFLTVAHIGEFPVDVAEPYVCVSDDDSRMHFFSAVGAPRQYLRALYGRLVGKEGAENWYAGLNIDDTVRSVIASRELFGVSGEDPT